MQFEITHSTRFVYDRLVQLQPHLLYLRPRDNPLLRVHRFELRFSPDAQVHWMRDDFDNLPASARFSSLTTTLSIESECKVTTSDVPPFDFLVRDYARGFPFSYEPLHRFNLGIYLSPPDASTQTAVRDWLSRHFPTPPSDTVTWLFELNATLFRVLTYGRRDEPGIQKAEATMALGTGTCRDYAELLIECLRTLGLAARFVSGYMFDASLDASLGGDMHAWAEVFLPGAGWRGLDPTHGVFCNNNYVPVAHAVVAPSVNPVQGSFFSPAPAQAQMSTRVSVRLGS